jgi:hypothetical protein
LAGGGSGTVQTISVATANGLAGTSDADPNNPTLTLSTTVTGILKGNGTAISAITVGSGLDYDGTTLSATGSGDVVGPASATDNAIVRFDGTTGKLVQNSTVTIDDSGNLVTPADAKVNSLTATDNRTNFNLNIPVTSGSAGHAINMLIDSNVALSIQATGDGAGGVGARTIKIGNQQADRVNFNGFIEGINVDPNTKTLRIKQKTGFVEGNDLLEIRNEADDATLWEIAYDGMMEARSGAHIGDSNNDEVWIIGSVTSNAVDNRTLQLKKITSQTSPLLSITNESDVVYLQVASDGLATLTNITDTASNQLLVLQSDRATPANNDEAKVSIRLSDSAGNQDEFARITGRATNVTSASEAGQIRFGVAVAGVLSDRLLLNGSNLVPTPNDGLALGAGTAAFSDLFLAEGGVINWDNGDVTLTQTGDVLAVAGGDLRVATAGVGTNADSVPTLSSTNTLTNKRITKRTGTTTSSATPTINTDNVDEYYITAQTADITSFTTNLSGTPTEGQTLFVAITGTAARAITWGASFENGPVALPTTTVTTTRLDVLLKWNTVTSKWRCMASGSTV